jgi:hypothetical protein
MEQAYDRFTSWYRHLSVEWKEKILKYVYEHRPRPHLNISELMGYENTGKGFDVDLAKGQIAEQMLQDILAGQVEVKCDSRVSQTGNVAVEYMCSGRPSGISTSQAPWWAFVLDGARFRQEVVVLIQKDRLVELLANQRSVSGGDGGRAQMYLLRKERLLE